MDSFTAIERRRRTLRIVLFSVILGTLPLYCLGFFLWGTAPNPAANTRTPTPTTTIRAATTVAPNGTNTLFPSATQPLINTPGQTFPTAVIPPTFVFPTQTPIIIFPTLTTAPSLTPVPTFTPITPTLTWTTIPIPTSTPITPTLTWTPITPTFAPPTETPTPTETMTETPTNTVIPP